MSLSAPRFAPKLFLTTSDAEPKNSKKKEEEPLEINTLEIEEPFKPPVPKTHVLPTLRLIEGSKITQPSSTVTRRPLKAITDRSLPTLRGASSRLLTELGEKQFILPVKDLVSDKDYSEHRDFIDHKLETLLGYMEQLSSVHGYTLQEGLSKLLRKPLPKYSAFSGATVQNHWHVLQSAFDQICEEVADRHVLLVEKEDRLVTLAKRHEAMLADRAYTLERLSELVKKRNESEAFQETQKKARRLLNEAGKIVDALPVDKGLMQRRAKFLFEQKYAQDWSTFKSPVAKPHPKQKVEQAYKTRDFWEDYSFFSKYDPSYKPAYIRKTKKAKIEKGSIESLTENA